MKLLNEITCNQFLEEYATEAFVQGVLNSDGKPYILAPSDATHVCVDVLLGDHYTDSNPYIFSKKGSESMLMATDYGWGEYPQDSSGGYSDTLAHIPVDGYLLAIQSIKSAATLVTSEQ